MNRIIKGEPESEFSMPFLQGMVNRLVQGFHKYGFMADAYPKKLDAMGILSSPQSYTKEQVDLVVAALGLMGSKGKRLLNYMETGNTEWLMDDANYSQIEFMHPRHKEAHFRATSTEESPGRKWVKKKELTAAANTRDKQDEQIVASVYRGREGD